MAQGKQTPRQKMINLMYLVFIAMLAMQIDQEIIRSYNDTNQTLTDTRGLVEKKNDNIFTMDLKDVVTVLFKKKRTSASVTCSSHRAFFTEEVGMVNNAYSHFHQIFTSISALDYVDRYIKDIILPKITKGKRLDVNVVADIAVLSNSPHSMGVKIKKNAINDVNITRKKEGARRIIRLL